MSRGSVPKSRQWGWHKIDKLPENQWRVSMRLSRATYVRLSQILVAQAVKPPVRRPAISECMQQKIALFRLGHDGNRACEFIFYRHIFFSRVSGLGCCDLHSTSRGPQIPFGDRGR